MTTLEELTRRSIIDRISLKDQNFRVVSCSCVMGTIFTKPLESATRKKIDQMLINLGWNVDEDDPDCNVFTERAKTVEQDKKFKGNDPDYVLYQSNSDNPIAIIEAKRKGQSIEDALKDAERKYAIPLDVKIIFAIDGTFIKSYHTVDNKELKIDDEPLHKLISEGMLLRFLKEGSDIDEVTKEVENTREELIKIFKWANDLLRREGLRNLDRFIEFSNILFIKIISEIEDDREKNGKERQLDKNLCWDSFCSMDNSKTMLNYINNTVLSNGLAKEYNHSDDIFQQKLKIKNPNAVKQIVDKLSHLTLLNTESEIKGDAFEYFLKSLASGNDLGEYFTPRHIVKLMVKLIHPRYGNTVFDPFCGTGGFLIEAFRQMKEGLDENDSSLMKVLKEDSIFGIELTDTYKIAKMNMIITGDGHNNIIQDDTAKNQYWNNKYLKNYFVRTKKEKGFDIILSNIPYGQPTDYGNLYPVPSNQGDSVFIQHIIGALKNGGRCSVIVPEGFLFNPEFIKVREYLLQQCDLTAVISLPSGVFMPYTKAKTNILVFEKGTSTKKVWFYILENDGFELNTKRRKISDNDIPHLLENWERKTNTEKSWTVTIDEIKKNKYDLLPKTYRPVESSSANVSEVLFSDIMKENKNTVTIDDSIKHVRITIKLHGQGVVLRDKIVGKEIKTKTQKVTKRNQFIVAEMDAKFGAFGIVPPELEGAIVSSHYFVFDLDEQKIMPKYFDYLIRYGPYTKQIQRFVRGTTNYSSIRPSDLLKLKIPLPSIPLQDSLIERMKKQENLLNSLDHTLESIRNGFIDEIIFEDLDNVERVKIGDITLKTQYGITKSVMPEGTGISLVRITDIDQFGRINFEKLPKIQATKKEYEKYLLNNGDLLIARSGATVGKCAVIEEDKTEKIFASYLIRYVLDKRVLPKYLMYYLLSNKIQEEIRKHARVTAQPNINPTQIASIEFPLPKSLEIQQKIIEKIEERLILYDLATSKRNEIKNTMCAIVNGLFKK